MELCVGGAGGRRVARTDEVGAGREERARFHASGRAVQLSSCMSQSGRMYGAAGSGGHTHSRRFTRHGRGADSDGLGKCLWRWPRREEPRNASPPQPDGSFEKPNALQEVNLPDRRPL